MTTIRPTRGVLRPSRRRWACARAFLAAAPLLTLLAAGCDFPTSLPKWDTQWLIPSKGTTLSVAQLLPASVSPVGDNSAFLVNIAPVSISRSLAELCSACGALAGQNVPKPAFSAVMTDTLRLPTDVAAATLASGTISLGIINGLSFDPIRPASGGTRGTVVITLTSGGATIGSLTMDGAADALPAHQTTTRSIALTGGAITSRIGVTVAVTSPLGDPVRIDGNERLVVTATPQTVRVTDVSVQVAQKQVSLQQQSMDLTDIDSSVIDRIREPNALILTVNNPFAVTGTLTLTFVNAAMPLTKPVPLQAGVATQRVTFTRDEMRALLGRMITLNAAGTVNAAAPVKITPAQKIQITTQFELTLGPKEG